MLHFHLLNFYLKKKKQNPSKLAPDEIAFLSLGENFHLKDHGCYNSLNIYSFS